MDAPRGYGRKNLTEKERVRKVRSEYEALRQIFSSWTSCPLSSKVDVLKVTYSVFCEILGIEAIHSHEVQEPVIPEDTRETEYNEQSHFHLRSNQRQVEGIRERTPNFIHNNSPGRAPQESLTPPFENELSHQSEQLFGQEQIPRYMCNSVPDVMPHPSMAGTSSNLMHFNREWRSVDVEDDSNEDEDEDNEEEDYDAVSDTSETHPSFSNQPGNHLPHYFQRPPYQHTFGSPFPPYSQLRRMYPGDNGHHDQPPQFMPAYCSPHTQWASTRRFPHPSPPQPQPSHITHPYPPHFPNMAPPSHLNIPHLHPDVIPHRCPDVMPPPSSLADIAPPHHHDNAPYYHHSLDPNYGQM